MKNPDGSHSHTPIDHDPRNDVPPQEGVDTEAITQDLENAITIAWRTRLRQLARENRVSHRRAVPFLISELERPGMSR